MRSKQLLAAWNGMPALADFPYYRAAMRNSILELARILADLDVADARLSWPKVHRVRSAYFRVLTVAQSKTYKDALLEVRDLEDQPVFDGPRVHRIQQLWREQMNTSWRIFNSGHRQASSTHGTEAERLTKLFQLDDQLKGELSRNTLTVGRIILLNPQPFVVPDDTTLLR
ncbi:MAG TPA: hypothetical protein VLA77_03170 [Candidatus Saccharimonadales bacterium]|nr:hypothetical protein [Candidatus Saccharimonadales bacterium]